MHDETLSLITIPLFTGAIAWGWSGFSREPLRDARRYQVLEAQTQVSDALERGGRTARTVRRSIVLTSFGEDFCAICLPLE